MNIDMSGTAMNHEDLVTMVRWMVANNHTPDEIADAVEKPWHHHDELVQAKAELQLAASTSVLDRGQRAPMAAQEPYNLPSDSTNQES